jgi:16S rRNA (adenine1518-N6/adenine1519-N6)-dimethyltransferase
VSGGKPLGRGELRALLAAEGVTPKRSRGQNFLVDPNMAERIVRLAGIGKGDYILEIGAGLGSLTRALAATGADVTAIEIDHRLAEMLSGMVPRNVRVVQADALEIDWEEALSPSDARWTLVANLPYNVATPLIIDLLVGVPQISRMLVMVQAEVGARLAAAAGEAEYGAPSVRVAYFATARVVLRVPPDVFYPRPNVDSVVVDILRRPVPAVREEIARYEEIDELVRAGFSGRRKMLRRSLKQLVPPEAFEAAGVRPEERAERLDVTAWGKLAACRRAIAS